MIEEGDRGFATGITGSGKSRLLGYYFATCAGQRLLIDVNDDYDLGPAATDEGACLARDPSAIDWDMRTIRYVPSRLDQDEYEALYAAIIARTWGGGRPLFVWLDEGEGPTSAQQAPPSMNIVLGQGRKKKVTHVTASLRPVEVFKKIRNQSEHCFAFATVDDDDVAMLARRFNVTRLELAAALAALPEHGFLYHRLGQTPAAFPPLDQARLDLAARHVRMP